MNSRVRLDLGQSSRPFCGVFAVALLRTSADPYALWDTFEGARTILKKKERWTGRMFPAELMALMDAYGILYSTAPFRKGTLLREVIPALDPEVPYVIETSGHYFVVYRGKGFDQHGPGGFTPEVGKRKLKSIWKIL